MQTMMQQQYRFAKVKHGHSPDAPRCTLQIHWFSIFNSFMMVIFLTGLVSMILLRTLRNDYAKCAAQLPSRSSNSNLTAAKDVVKLSAQLFKLQHRFSIAVLLGTTMAVPGVQQARAVIVSAAAKQTIVLPAEI